jgi:hypothetical protein
VRSSPVVVGSDAAIARDASESRAALPASLVRAGAPGVGPPRVPLLELQGSRSENDKVVLRLHRGPAEHARQPAQPDDVSEADILDVVFAEK